MEDAKRHLVYSKTISTDSTGVCEKDLKVRFPVQILFFEWAEEAVWGCLL